MSTPVQMRLQKGFSDGFLEEERFQPLPITLAHALAVVSLPSIHQDPFEYRRLKISIVDADADRFANRSIDTESRPFWQSVQKCNVATANKCSLGLGTRLMDKRESSGGVRHSSDMIVEKATGQTNMGNIPNHPNPLP